MIDDIYQIIAIAFGVFVLVFEFCFFTYLETKNMKKNMQHISEILKKSKYQEYMYEPPHKVSVNEVEYDFSRSAKYIPQFRISLLASFHALTQSVSAAVAPLLHSLSAPNQSDHKKQSSQSEVSPFQQADQMIRQ